MQTTLLQRVFKSQPLVSKNLICNYANNYYGDQVCALNTIERNVQPELLLNSKR